jgi:nicotinamidase-related amidase
LSIAHDDRQAARGAGAQPRETAILTIDMHRGHLDPAVATMAANPEDARRVIAAARELLDFARERGLPVVPHQARLRRIPRLGSEGMTQPFWRAIHELSRHRPPDARPRQHGRRAQHHGLACTEIIAGALQDGDHVIDNKKRLDCFYGTDPQSAVAGVRAPRPSA